MSVRGVFMYRMYVRICMCGVQTLTVYVNVLRVLSHMFLYLIMHG